MKKIVKNCPSYHLISNAASGHAGAVNKLLQFYDAYISKASLRPLYDDCGNVYIAVDMELKGLVRKAMAEKMHEFVMEIK